MRGHYEIRVVHVLRDENDIADAIPRHNLSKTLDVESELIICDFEPPQCWIGAVKK